MADFNPDDYDTLPVGSSTEPSAVSAKGFNPDAYDTLPVGGSEPKEAHAKSKDKFTNHGYESEDEGGLYPVIKPDWKSVPTMAAFMAPELALTGLTKFSPVVNALSKIEPWFQQHKVANSLAKMGRNAATSAAGSALVAPEGQRDTAAIQGGGLGVLGSALSQALGVSNPLVRALLAGGAGAGLGAGTATVMPEIGISPGKAALYGGGAAAGLSKFAGAMPAGFELLENINPEAVKPTLEAGRRLGTNLTPAEASGNPFVAGQEGRYKASPEASAYNVDASKQKLSQQQNAINNLKQTASQGYMDSSHAIRGAAQDYLQELKTLRSNSAEPHYKAAEKMEVPQHEVDKLLEIPRIKNTFNKILEDPDYIHELGGEQPTGKKMAAATEHMIDRAIINARSKPYNKSSIDDLEYARDNFRKNYDEPRVQNVLKNIYDEDPVLYATSKGVNLRSGRFLDLAKKLIDQDAENMGSKLNATGQNRYKAGLMGDASKKITEMADQYIEPYRKARSVFSSMSPEITQTEESVLGRLANLDDTKLKNASSMIFDPAQTNLHVLGNIKKSIMRRNPEAWDGIVRSEMERLTKKGVSTGKNFFNTVLANDNQFKQFELALDHNPEALQSLRDMKNAWKDLINLESTSSAHHTAMKGLDQSRAFPAMIVDEFNRITGAKRNIEALKFIHSRNWDEAFDKIKAYKDDAKRREATANLISKLISGEIMTRDK